LYLLHYAAKTELQKGTYRENEVYCQSTQCNGTGISFQFSYAAMYSLDATERR